MAFAESVPIRDPDKGNLSSLPESLIQSILTHAGKQQLVSLTANRLSWSRDTATYSRNDLLRNGKLSGILYSLIVFCVLILYYPYARRSKVLGVASECQLIIPALCCYHNKGRQDVCGSFFYASFY